MKTPSHGTEYGYQNHLRDGTPKCAPCRRAHADKRADYRRRRYLHHAPLSVDACGTRRRIHALAAIGWSMGEQSRRLGQEVSWAHATAARTWVTFETAEKVAALYDELSMVPGPNARARNDARRKGWLPPLCFDDDTIDAPDVPPAGGLRTGDEPQRTNRDRGREAKVLELTRAGLSAADIALRLRTNKRYVQRVRSRYRTEGDAA